MSKIAIRSPGRNQIIIDDTYHNFVLREKRTVNLPITTPVEVAQIKFDIINNIPPIVAMRPSTDNFCCTIGATVIESDTVVDYQVIGKRLSGSATTGSLVFYVFDMPSSLSGAVGPLILRNKSTGQITFDSGRKYMRVMQFIHSLTNVNNTYNFPGKTVACVMGAQPFQIRLYAQPNPHADLTQSSLRKSSNSLIIDSQAYEFSSGSHGGSITIDASGASAMILDVSGY